jgi:hypothetical protein
MSITARDAGSFGLSLSECEENIKLLCKQIDDKILTHPSSIGKNILEFGLPTVFTKIVANDTAKTNDTRIYIYGRICKSLIERGFEVCLYLKGRENILIISWESIFNKRDFDETLQLIKKIRISSEDEYNKYISSIKTNI